MILKPNLVRPGLSCATPAALDEVADATLGGLRRNVPAAVAGIAFLSGGQPAALATARLNAMHLRTVAPGPAPDAASRGLSWPLTFSFARALQQTASSAWAGLDANRVAAQRALLHRARCNTAAVRGAWFPAMETEGVPG